MIKFDTSQLEARLDAMLETALAGGDRGLDDIGDIITADMQATDAHGDVTGATRASYVSYRVGHGKTGQEALDSLDAVGALNPGHSAHDTVTLHGTVGLIIMSGTDYQVKLENSDKAVLTPTFLAYYLAAMQAFADGINDAL